MGELPPLKASYEQLRSLVVETLSPTVEGGWQFGSFYSSVGMAAVKKGFAPDPYAGQTNMRAQSHHLHRSDQARAQNILWDLIIEGIIRPGLGDGGNTELPFFHVTEYGNGVLKDGPTSPYDPDGYMKRLKANVQDLDAVIETYLDESLHTFRIGCLLSSTVTLGCASEKALLLLIAAYGDYLSAGQQAKFRNATKNQMIKRQFEEFTKMLDSHLKALLPPHLKEDLDVALISIFAMLRNMRNDAGHPTGRPVEREQAYANLIVFSTYLTRVYALMEWLKKNKAAADEVTSG